MCRKANFPHNKVEKRHGLGVSSEFLLLCHGLPPASDVFVVLFSILCREAPSFIMIRYSFHLQSSMNLENNGLPHVLR